MKSHNEVRLWWTGRCARCLTVMKRVEVGEDDARGRAEMDRLGYVVSKEPGPVTFRPHAADCA